MPRRGAYVGCPATGRWVGSSDRLWRLPRLLLGVAQPVVNWAAGLGSGSGGMLVSDLGLGGLLGSGRGEKGRSVRGRLGGVRRGSAWLLS